MAPRVLSHLQSRLTRAPNPSTSSMGGRASDPLAGEPSLTDVMHPLRGVAAHRLVRMIVVTTKRTGVAKKKKSKAHYDAIIPSFMPLCPVYPHPNASISDPIGAGRPPKCKKCIFFCLLSQTAQDLTGQERRLSMVRRLRRKPPRLRPTRTFQSLSRTHRSHQRRASR